MAYIVRGLQTALAICPLSGIPRTKDELLLSSALPTSPLQVTHVKDIADKALALARAQEEARIASERIADEEAERKKDSDAAAARKKESDAAAAAKAKPLRGRSMTPPKKDAEAAVEASAAAAPPTGRLWRLKRWVSDRFNSNPANPPHDPNSDGLDGGTVKRRFRVQKRQKQTMRPCNIRRQRRTHAIRRRRNKNKTH
jgi:hypothetical protein